MQTVAFTCKEFSITQENTVLKLGTDAFLLGSFVNKKAQTVLDIGTGCGILALMQAQKNPLAQIDAIDIDESSLKDAQANFNNSKWSNNITPYCSSIQDYALTTPVKYDLIICNPPFFKDSLLSTNQRKNQARHTITLTAQSLIKVSSELLTPHGEVAIIIPFSNKDEYIGAALNNNLFLIEELTIKPLQSKEPNRSILVFSLKSQLIKKQELIIRKDNHEYSSHYKELTKDFYLSF